MDKVEDIVFRLKKSDVPLLSQPVPFSEVRRNIREAADLIQSQQALIEEMREALRRGRHIFWGSTEANISEAEKWVDNVDGIMFRSKALSQKE